VRAHVIEQYGNQHDDYYYDEQQNGVLPDELNLTSHEK
jgi:hypothetical protein